MNLSVLFVALALSVNALAASLDSLTSLQGVWQYQNCHIEAQGLDQGYTGGPVSGGEKFNIHAGPTYPTNRIEVRIDSVFPLQLANEPSIMDRPGQVNLKALQFTGALYFFRFSHINSSSQQAIGYVAAPAPIRSSFNGSTIFTSLSRNYTENLGFGGERVANGVRVQHEWKTWLNILRPGLISVDFEWHSTRPKNSIVKSHCEAVQLSSQTDPALSRIPRE